MKTKRRRVTQSFSAQQSTSRARGNFAVGDLLILQETPEAAEQLRFVLTEGKKRQIRRMCEQVGLKVVGLKRVRIGRVMLGNLPVGQWRYLAPHEQF